MNRAERRRQEKATREPSVPERTFPTTPQAIAALKAELQRATSPEQVQHIIAALVAQGLPPAAGKELQVYAAAYHDATAIFRTGASTEVVSTVVNNTHGWADTIIDHSPQRDQRACRAGCAFCCYLPTVIVTAAEVVHLAAWLRTQCSPEELTALRQRLDDRLKQQTAPSSTSSTKTPLPCALLQDNHCMAYPARPLKCRGWNSVRLEACEQAYGHSQSTSQVPVDAYAFVMGNAVLNGLSDSASHVGLDGASYDLTRALARALDMPDVVQRWGNGERLFDVPQNKPR
jgi:hypothetical protein